MANIELIINLKNKLDQALNKASGQVERFRSDSQRRLDSLKAQKLNLNTMSLGGGVSADKMNMVDGLRSQIPQLDSSLTMAGNSAMIVGAGIMAIGGGLAYATKLSSEWEQGMAKVNVTAQMNKTELKGLSDQLRTIGRDAPVDIMQIPDAFNMIISAVGDVNKSLNILPLALTASKAGFTDLKTVADASVSVINASGRKPDEVFNVLFATMNKGKAEFKDIADYLPKIIPSSKALGLSLEQTAGSWAFLTAKGLKAEQATVGMQNLLKSFQDMKVLDKFKSQNIDIFNANGSLKKMTDVIATIKGKMNGLSDKGRTTFLDSLGLDQEASMALGLMVQNVDDLKNTIGFVGNGADHLHQAFINSATSTDLWVKIINRAKFELMQVGDKILTLIRPPLIWIYKNLDTIVMVIKSLAIGIGVAGMAWVAMQAPMLIIKGIQLAILGVQMLMNATNPFGWIALAIAGISFLWLKFAGFREMVMGSWEAIKMTATILWQNLKTIFMGVLDMIGGVAKAIGNALIGNFGAISANIEQVKKGHNDIQKNIISNKDAAQNINIAYKNGVYKQRKSEAEQKISDAKEKKDLQNPTGAGTGFKGSESNKTSTGVQRVQDGVSSQNKTINVTINGGLVNTLTATIQQANPNASIREIEDMITETLMKAIRNFESNV